jgi:hypothetical protein
VASVGVVTRCNVGTVSSCSGKGLCCESINCSGFSVGGDSGPCKFVNVLPACNVGHKIGFNVKAI